MKIISSDVYECSRCLKFNAKLMRCDLAENVPECTYINKKFSHIPQPNTTEIASKMCTGPGKFSIPYDRRRYYDCTDKFNSGQYLLRIRRCPPNKIFCERLAQCRSKCAKPEVDPRKCEENHYSYDHYECRKFFHCQRGKPKVPLLCPSSYIFNGNYCQYQDNVSFCDWGNLKSICTNTKNM